MAPNATGFYEPISNEECLKCAFEREIPPCGFDYSLLKYIYSHKRYRALDIHVSDLLVCPRRAWYDKQIEYPETAASRFIVTLGTLQHALLEEMEDETYLAENIVETSDGNVVGTVDAYYHNGRIVDYKTTRNANLKYLPQKKHAMQVNIYAHMLRAMHKKHPERFPNTPVGEDPVKSAAIQYIDFLGPTKCPRCKSFVVTGPEDVLICPLCEVPVDNAHLGALLLPVKLWSEEKIAELVEERADYLQKCIDDRKIPEQTEPDFLCRYCPFLGLCQEGQAEITRR